MLRIYRVKVIALLDRVMMKVKGYLYYVPSLKNAVSRSEVENTKKEPIF